MPLKEIQMPAGSGPHATPRGVPRCGATPTPVSFMQRIRDARVVASHLPFR